MDDVSCCKPTKLAPNTQDELLASILELFAHPIRLSILRQLGVSQGSVCVCEIEAALPVKQPTVSHHLRILREAGLIRSEKKGQWVYYGLVPQALGRVFSRVNHFYQSLALDDCAPLGSIAEARALATAGLAQEVPVSSCSAADCACKPG